jgi:uncharacterized membrane protein
MPVDDDGDRRKTPAAMCLVFLIALIAPRVALALMWIFGERVDNAFEDMLLWPALGLIFAPVATIMYVLVWDPQTGVTGGEWLLVAAGAAVDVISFASRLAKASRPYG